MGLNTSAAYATVQTRVAGEIPLELEITPLDISASVLLQSGGGLVASDAWLWAVGIAVWWAGLAFFEGLTQTSHLSYCTVEYAGFEDGQAVYVAWGAALRMDHSTIRQSAGRGIYYEHAGHGFAAHGIDVKGLSIDVPRMIARKEKVVAQNNDGILYLFKKNKVAFHHGRGAFAGGSAKSGWLVSVAGDAPAELSASHVIVATGSKPRPLPGVAFDRERVLDNAGALAIPASADTSAYVPSPRLSSKMLGAGL